jgi:hypothetical protein
MADPLQIVAALSAEIIYQVGRDRADRGAIAAFQRHLAREIARARTAW